MYINLPLIFIHLLLPSLTLAASLSSKSSTTSTESPASSHSAASSSLPKLIIFSFDGFRSDYVNATDTPNLYALAKDGVTGHLKSAFVTKTYPNHHTIATGLYLPWHGIINNQFIDPSNNHSFNVDDPSDASFWWDQHNVSVPIYIANEQYEPNVRFSGAVQWPGSIASYTDGHNRTQRHRINYLKDYDKDMSWEKRIDLALAWLTDPVKPANLVFIYFPEPDDTAHEFGPFSSQVKEQIKHLDEAVGYFRKKMVQMKLSHKTNVIFLSDHGMAEVNVQENPDRIFYLSECKKLDPNLEYDIYGVSPVYSIQPRPSKQSFITKDITNYVRHSLNQCSEKLFKGKFRVYRQEDIPPEYHYGNNQRILPLFLIAEDGYDVWLNATGWKPKGYPVWGNHGYNNSAPSMRPLFIAQGPRFKSGYTQKTVFENVDLYPLFLHLLQIPLSRFPSNGSFERVKELLSNKLYDSDDGYLKDHLQRGGDSEPTDVMIRFFIYTGIGFALIVLLGACFILTTGYSRGSVRGKRYGMTGPGGRDGSNLVSALFRRFRASDQFAHSRLRSSAYEYSNRRHLDSSLDTEEEEDELYSNGIGHNAQNKSPKRNSSSDHLTEIDWDIIGTGLDIDLNSQLSPGMKPSAKQDYRDVPTKAPADQANRGVSTNYRSLLSVEYESGEDTEGSEDTEMLELPDRRGDNRKTTDRMQSISLEDDDEQAQRPDNRLIDF